MAMKPDAGKLPVPKGFMQPGQSAGLISVMKRRYLLGLLVRKEVQVRYRGSILGWLWSYAKPLTQFAVFYLALGLFLRQSEAIENYAVYIFSGLIVVNLFSEAFSNGTRSLVDNASLIKKIYLPRELFPVSSSLVALVNFLPQLAVIVVVCMIIGWTPSPLQLVGVVFGALIVVVFATGLGMLFGSINVSFRDAQNFVELIVLVATWVSPVLYPVSMVQSVLPEWAVLVYQLNPLTAAVELMHAGLWFPTTETSGALASGQWATALASFGITLLVLIAGQLVFRRLEGRFAQDL
jgi:ABC-2 type transport system permease protein